MLPHDAAAWSSGQMGYIDPVLGHMTEPGLFFHPYTSTGGKAGWSHSKAYGSYVNPHLLRTDNPKVVDWHGSSYSHAGMIDAIKKAWNAGNDLVLIKNISDIGGGVHDQLVVRHPYMVRHPKAAFSLKDAMSPNLMAARGVGGTPMLVQDKDLEEEKENAE
jgi:hypothetical protein